jgi:hypothetical protein
MDLTPEQRRQIYEEEKAKLDSRPQTTTFKPVVDARRAKKSQLNKTSWLLFAASVLLALAGLYSLAALCFIAAFVLAIAYYVV